MLHGSAASLLADAKARKARETQLADVMKGIRGVRHNVKKQVKKPVKVVKKPPQVSSNWQSLFQVLRSSFS